MLKFRLQSNSDTHFYNRENKIWIVEMKSVFEAIFDHSIPSDLMNSTFGDSKGLRWCYEESTGTLIVTGDDSLSHSYTYTDSQREIKTQFYSEAELKIAELLAVKKCFTATAV